MSNTKLNHLSVRNVYEGKVFADVKSYGDLTNAINEYGDAAGEAGSKAYNDKVGEALEVYAEFFLQRFGNKSNTRFGVIEATHTSDNKFQEGYDFSFRDLNGMPGQIQVKFRRNPTHKFTRRELGTFISKADEDGIPKERRLLFTNQDHKATNNSYGVFHPSYKGGLKQMRVIDRTYQEEMIDRDPSFWQDLTASVAQSGQEPASFLPIRTLRPHQQRMFDAAVKQIKADGERGRLVCATGGGKTEVEFQLIRWMYTDRNAKLCVVVAPTIDLLKQHHQYFEQFGMFSRSQDKISVIHFRTGDEARTDDYIHYSQMTDESGFAKAMANYNGDQVVIFVTYASEQHLFDIMHKRGLTADLVVWDEFHHCVTQDVDQLNHLMSLPADHNLFFSASLKRGRIVSSLDENVFGPLLENITYAELRKSGILIPQVLIKAIRVNTKGKRLHAIARELKKAAERKEFDLKDAIVEAAATIVARENLMTLQGRSNIVTFSKGVAICKAITESETVKTELVGALLQTVHASVPARDRKTVYEKVKASDDSVLIQFAVVKEGIDITPFNAAIISRNMDVIGTQQGIGRIVRADPADTLAFQKGEITLDSDKGWKKYTGTVYVIIHDDGMENFKKFIRDLITKLQFSGLEDSDYQMSDIVEEYNGVGDKNNADVPIENLNELFDKTTLREYAQALQVEMDREEALDRLKERVNAAPSLAEALKELL